MRKISAETWIHLSLAFLWIYQGLVPKLLFINADEIAVWQYLGLSLSQAVVAGQAAGVAEILFGMLLLLSRHRYLHYLNILGLWGLLLLIGFILPDTLIRAFNPVVLNISMMSLSIIYLALMPQQSKQTTHPSAKSQTHDTTSL